ARRRGLARFAGEAAGEARRPEQLFTVPAYSLSRQTAREPAGREIAVTAEAPVSVALRVVPSRVARRRRIERPTAGQMDALARAADDVALDREADSLATRLQRIARRLRSTRRGLRIAASERDEARQQRDDGPDNMLHNHS